MTRRLLCPLVTQAIPGLPSPNAVINASQAIAARAVLKRSERAIEAELRLIRAGVDEGVKLGRDMGLEVSARDLADKLARAARCGGGRRCLEDQMRMEVAAYLRQRVPAGRVMTRAQFERYAERYAASWAEAGQHNLANFPYSTYSLGPDEGPPLVVAGRESTWLGLGRSIYSRYRLAAQDSLVVGEAHEIAEAEVVRACGPLGVVGRSALVTLCSISIGLLYGPVGFEWKPPRDTDFDGQWRSEAEPLEPCCPRSADPFLPRGTLVHAELAAFTQASMAAFLSGTRQGTMLRRAGLVERAHQHVMRRAWMMCFEAERRGVSIDGARAARIVSYAVFKGIPGGEAHRQRQLALGGAELGSAGEMGLAQEDLARSLEWLASHREVALRLLSDSDAEGARAYREAAEQLGLPSLEALLAHFGRSDA